LFPEGVKLLIILLPLITVIVEKIKKRISRSYFLGFLIILIILFFSMVLVSLSQECSRCAYRWQIVKADMRQLRTAQGMFYEKNNRFADTQEELINNIIFRVVLKNIITNQEFTDGDGEGIEGSDNDPKTWSARTYIPYQKINKWCHLMSSGYWYVCNQDGCYEETGVLN
jgi:hypothetical protein